MAAPPAQQAQEQNPLEFLPLGPPTAPVPINDHEVLLPMFDLNSVPPAITINLELNDSVEHLPVQVESPVIQLADPLDNAAALVSPRSDYSSLVDEEIKIIKQPEVFASKANQLDESVAEIPFAQPEDQQDAVSNHQHSDSSAPPPGFPDKGKFF